MQSEPVLRIVIKGNFGREAVAGSRLTDDLRAKVFVRDRGVCSFSGQSLWVFDSGATPLFEHDWPDHIKPISRGGKNELENLAVAGADRNWSKSNNSRDTGFLFSRGVPSYNYFPISTLYSDKVFASMRAHKNLVDSDWYFNRSVSSIFIWAYTVYWGGRAKRGKHYWLGSGWKRLQIWQRFSREFNVASFRARGLVPYPRSPDIVAILRLRNCESYKSFCTMAEIIRTHYSHNQNLWWQYLEAPTPRSRKKIANRYLTTRPSLRSRPMIEWLHINQRRLHAMKGPLYSE